MYFCYRKIEKMTTLYQKYLSLLENTSTSFKRYLYHNVSWNNRMSGIIGARGVGKTTLLLQYIKENLDPNKALYVSADDLYFTENTLFDLSMSCYKNSIEYLFIDEVHKYTDWSRELKNIYDSLPGLKVVFTGSSVLDIIKGTSDLSRRAVVYKLHGLSFREYLHLFHDIHVDTYTLEQIVNNDIKPDFIQHPLPLFNAYLKEGYYPFSNESEYNIRLHQVILQTLETDIPQFANLTSGTSRKLKHLLSIIAGSVPFKPNFSKLSEMIGVSRNSLYDYFYYMEQAGLIAQLHFKTAGIRALGKVEKVYLENTNLIYNLVGESANMGNLRETFFMNQMSLRHNVFNSNTADFTINNYTFEVGGKNKKQTQIKNEIHSFLVKDDIEYGYQNVIPLWAFGFNY